MFAMLAMGFCRPISARPFFAFKFFFQSAADSKYLSAGK